MFCNAFIELINDFFFYCRGGGDTYNNHEVQPNRPHSFKDNNRQGGFRDRDNRSEQNFRERRDFNERKQGFREKRERNNDFSERNNDRR